MTKDFASSMTREDSEKSAPRIPTNNLYESARSSSFGERNTSKRNTSKRNTSKSNTSKRNASKLPKISDFKFGFEYEALVGINMNAETNALLEKLTAQILGAINDPKTRESIHCKNIIELTMENMKLKWRKKSFLADFIIRYMFVLLLNSSSRQTFQFAPEYHNDLDVCVPKMLDDKDTGKDTVCDKDNCWTVTSDSSVRTGDDLRVYSNDHHSVKKAYNVENEKTLLESIEIVSPILKWRDLTKKRYSRSASNSNKSTSNSNKNNTQGIVPSFHYVLDDALKANGLFEYYNNNYTSNHIHLSLNDTFKDPCNVVDIAMAWWYFEPLFFSIVAPFRTNNKYCKSFSDQIKSNINIVDKVKNVGNIHSRMFETTSLQSLEARYDDDPDSIRDFVTKYFQGDDRFCALNLSNMYTIGTIEVRLKHGSTSSLENVMWMKLMAYFFYAALVNESVTTIDLELSGVDRPIPFRDLSSRLNRLNDAGMLNKLKDTVVKKRNLIYLFSYFEMFMRMGTSRLSSSIRKDVDDCLSFWRDRLVREDEMKYAYLTRTILDKFRLKNPVENLLKNIYVGAVSGVLIASSLYDTTNLARTLRAL